MSPNALHHLRHCNERPEERVAAPGRARDGRIRIPGSAGHGLRGNSSRPDARDGGFSAGARAIRGSRLQSYRSSLSASASMAVTVFPSIDNWRFAGKSHYWITHGRVRWAEQWPERQIMYGRPRDRIAKQVQYGECDVGTRPAAGRPGQVFRARLWRLIAGRK